MGRSGLGGRLAAGAACAVAIGLGLWALQAAQASEERRAAVAESERLRKMVTALEVIGRKADEFGREVQQLAEKQAMLDMILPPTLGVSAFLEEFRASARTLGVTVGDSPYQEDVSKALQRADIVPVFSGPPEAVEALRLRTHRMRRLVDWRVGSRGSILLTVYAFPGPGAVAPPECRLPQSRVWLWPYSVRVAGARAEWAGLCARVEELRDIRARVDAFEAARNRFQAVVTEIEKLRPPTAR
jgi:hypothetical protein